MDITRRTDYAIRMMLELAREDEAGPISVRELAERQDVPYAFARGIQRELVSAGFVETVRGAKGGVRLARPAKEITLLDLVSAMQGAPTCAVCTSDPKWCQRMSGCSVHSVWRGIDHAMSEYLERQDLASLIRGQGGQVTPLPL